MALALEFEQSMQSIDPSVSMPYWEYGMETYLYDSYTESPIFSDDWCVILFQNFKIIVDVVLSGSALPLRPRMAIMVCRQASGLM